MKLPCGFSNLRGNHFFHYVCVYTKIYKNTWIKLKKYLFINNNVYLYVKNKLLNVVACLIKDLSTLKNTVAAGSPLSSDYLIKYYKYWPNDLTPEEKSHGVISMSPECDLCLNVKYFSHQQGETNLNKWNKANNLHLNTTSSC